MRKLDPTIISSTKSLRLTVGIATTGRAEVLARTVTHIERQTRLPNRIIVSAINESDFNGTSTSSVPLECITTGRGASQQRNHILNLCAQDDYILFFDDDFLPCDDYIENLISIFEQQPEVALITGTVLADGILSGGLSFETAESILDKAPTSESEALVPVYNGYGCNMGVRRTALRDHTRFDENLPLYSWLEDVDFSRLLASHGEIVRAPQVRGVHLGVKSGRTAGMRLGYSQIVNPFYLGRKGTVHWSFCARLAFRNITANCIKTIKPEPYIDRAGRLKGNLVGLLDIVRGKADPTRIIDL